MAKGSSSPVKTNSISFSVAKHNESAFARQVADLFHTDHQEFYVTPDAVPIVEKLAWHYDEPFADSSAVPTYYVSETAGKNVTVSLSGDGGDENFAGYRRYYFDMRENAVRNMVPAGLRNPVFGTVGRLYPKADYLSKIQYLDIKTYLCDDILTKVDRASMAVSLEVRCPILDHVFMEYAAKIPSHFKLKGKDGKHIFKKALKQYLPDDILYRKKMGFGGCRSRAQAFPGVFHYSCQDPEYKSRYCQKQCISGSDPTHITRPASN